jgi:hypothetical protein
MKVLPYSEACERNKSPIREALADYLPGTGCVLEIGSCSGQHVEFFAPAFPHLNWQPSDRLEYFQGLNARVTLAGVPTILDPIELDVMHSWPDRVYDAVYSANTAHIMSWSAVEAMFAGVGCHLAPGGVFCLYGPFIEEGGEPSPSNVVFDRNLRARDPVMGVRKLAELEKLAEGSQLGLIEKRRMPANNLMLVFRKKEENEDD